MGFTVAMAGRTWVLMSALVGCAGSSNGPCADAACRQAQVERVFDTQPGQLAAALEILDAPVEQIALVRRFVDRGGTDLESLCRQVPDALATMRFECGRMLVRPHLRTPGPGLLDDAAARSKRPAPGPAWPALRPAGSWPNPWADTVGVPAACPDEAVRSTCQHEAALAAARVGDDVAVAAACVAIPTSHWRDDCFFDAVKTMAAGWDLARVGPATGLCAGTRRDWQDLCLERAITGHNSGPPTIPVPTSGQPGHPGWTHWIARAAAARAALAPVDPTLADAAVARLWGEVLARSTQHSAGLSGDLFDVLPAGAHPQLRAALAWQVWQRSDTEGLAPLHRELMAVIESRVPASAPGLSSTTEPQPPEIAGWVRDSPGEDRIPSVTYFYGDRRAVSADLSTDALVCLLEAAARLPRGPRARALLLEAGAHTSGVVRWTAARLMEHQLRPARVAPGSTVGPDAAQLAEVERWVRRRAEAVSAAVRRNPGEGR